MTHVDEALRRARSAAGAEAGPPRAEDRSATPSASPFVPPWTFEASQNDRPEDERRAANTVDEPPASVEARAARALSGVSQAAAEKLVTASNIEPAPLEQYRKLAAALDDVQAEQGVRVVMVASAVAGEGKTLTAANLALTLSQSYQRTVLLVDADLRRPALHEVLAVPNVGGLGDGLRSGGSFAIAQITPRLALLTAGPPQADPMGDLASARMRAMLDEARQHFDWVVVDTPPVTLLPDAHLLARIVDRAVLVIQAGKTALPVIARAVEVLGRTRILGVVLNRVNGSQGSYGYQYERYFRARSAQRG